jgi:hypothetical protein
MNCYDCYTTNNRVTPANATCNSCGAAVCAEHAHASLQAVRRTGMGVTTLPRAARVLFCGTCASAQQVA